MASPSRDPDSAAVQSVEAEFVENWGKLAETFGMNGDLGRVHALIYVAETPASEATISADLGFPEEKTRGYIRELLEWGVIRSIDESSGRSLTTERDPWEFFLQIVAERHRREFLPVLGRMRSTLSSARSLGGTHTREKSSRERIEHFTGFVEELSRLIDLFVRVGSKPMALVLKTMAKIAPRTRSPRP